MLRPQFKEEPVTLLKSVIGTSGPLGEKTTSYQPANTVQGLVTALGAEEAVRLGLKADVSRFRVRLPAGTVLTPNDRLRFRGRDWKANLVTVYTSYTRVMVEGV